MRRVTVFDNSTRKPLADKQHVKEGHAHLRPSAAEADSAGANKLRPPFDATPDGFQGIQGQRTLLPSDWKESVFGRIMKKVDTSRYWDDWSADIAMVADRYIHSFAHLLEDAERQDPFQEFVGTLHQTLNPSADTSRRWKCLPSTFSPNSCLTRCFRIIRSHSRTR